MSIFVEKILCVGTEKVLIHSKSYVFDWNIEKGTW